MTTNIVVKTDDKMELLKMLESIGTPFEMHGDTISIDKHSDLSIIAALTLSGYNYSVTYAN